MGNVMSSVMGSVCDKIAIYSNINLILRQADRK